MAAAAPVAWPRGAPSRPGWRRYQSACEIVIPARRAQARLGRVVGHTDTTHSVSLRPSALPGAAWPRLTDRKPDLTHALSRGGGRAHRSSSAARPWVTEHARLHRYLRGRDPAGCGSSNVIEPAFDGRSWRVHVARGAAYRFRRFCAAGCSPPVARCGQLRHRQFRRLPDAGARSGRGRAEAGLGPGWGEVGAAHSRRQQRSFDNGGTITMRRERASMPGVGRFSPRPCRCVSGLCQPTGNRRV